MTWFGKFKLVGTERWGARDGEEAELLIKEHAFHVEAADRSTQTNANDLSDATYTIVYPGDLEPTDATREWHESWSAREAAFRLMSDNG
jgi:hypothetical protein